MSLEKLAQRVAQPVYLEKLMRNYVHVQNLGLFFILKNCPKKIITQPAKIRTICHPDHKDVQRPGGVV
jgi:hypothetical protein